MNGMNLGCDSINNNCYFTIAMDHKGSRLAKNLAIPPYTFLSDTKTTVDQAVSRTNLGYISIIDKREFGGSLCHYHCSQYDTSQRIGKDLASKNLLSDTKKSRMMQLKI